jgi:large subunit ribosomal protein L18
MTFIHTLKRIKKHKTNYRKRSALLISRRYFITVKVSNQNVAAQILKSTAMGDIVIASAHSRELKKHGWKGSMNSLPACYLTGLLLGKKCIENRTKNAILYTGKDRFTKRIAACIKGIVSAGVNVPVSDQSLPTESRISGQHIAEYARILKKDQEKYDARFSMLLKEGLKPEDYPSHFEEIKTKVFGKKIVPNNEELEEEEASANDGGKKQV